MHGTIYCLVRDLCNEIPNNRFLDELGTGPRFVIVTCERQTEREREHFESSLNCCVKCRERGTSQMCKITSLSLSRFLCLTRFDVIKAVRVVRVKLLVQSSPVHSLSACLSAQRGSLRLGLERQRRSQTNRSQIRLTSLSACLRKD